MPSERIHWKKTLRNIPLTVGFSVRLLFWPTLCALVVGGLLHLTGLDQMAAWKWIIAAPFLYFIWLVLLLSGYTLETTLLRSHLVKPRRMVLSEKTPPLKFSLILALYARMELIPSLPGSVIFKIIPGLKYLWYRAYSPSIHMGHLSMIGGILNDPDLTFVSRGVIVGEGCQLVAHTISRLPDGKIIFHTAPIRLGRYVTVGGGTRIEMGVTIGAGSLVEARSHVLQFTEIPPGEVWGGAPAVFRRKRNETATSTQQAAVTASISRSSSSDLLNDVLAVIAQALNLPSNEINAESSSSTCIVWDSVGKMAIAAGLHDRFGISPGPDEIFELDSVSLILQFLEKEKKADAKSTEKKNVELPHTPELLPLFDPAETTTTLAGKTSDFFPSPQFQLRICIAASFVAEPLAPTLKLWCRAFGIEADIAFAGFNQLQGELLSPESLFHQNREGLNVVLTRPEDLTGTNRGDASLAAGQLLAAIERFSSGASHALLVADLPLLISMRFTGFRDEAEPVRNLWRERLASLARIDQLNFSSIIEELGTVASRDDAMETQASTPYSPAVFQRLGIAIARFARRLRLPPKKVAAIDADGVLWGGVVGEDGIDALRTGGVHRQLQQQFLEWKKQGALLVLVSRNEPEDVWAVFNAYPEMPLKRADFATAFINWKPKSQNLRDAARELNLGLDSFVFIDDNPGERAEVQAACPEVTVVPFPAEPAQAAAMLDRLWCFDSTGTTAEDAQRTQLIQSEADRKAFAASAQNYDDYLRSLELQVEIRLAQSADLPRVAQLTQKTNQFNLSLRRRTQGEIETLSGTHAIWIVSAKDRFGDYGMIGVGILAPYHADKSATLDTFLMSCRALGRGIEEIFLHCLGKVAQRHEITRLLAPHIPGPRNQPMRDFFTRQRWTSEDGSIFTINVGDMPLPPTHAQVDFSLSHNAEVA